MLKTLSVIAGCTVLTGASMVAIEYAFGKLRQKLDIPRKASNDELIIAGLIGLAVGIVVADKFTENEILRPKEPNQNNV